MTTRPISRTIQNNGINSPAASCRLDRRPGTYQSDARSGVIYSPAQAPPARANSAPLVRPPMSVLESRSTSTLVAALAYLLLLDTLGLLLHAICSIFDGTCR